MQKINKRLIFSIVVLVLVLIFCISNISYTKDNLTLFNSDEAKKLRLSSEEWRKPPSIKAFRILTTGPRIVFKQPQVAPGSKPPTISTGSPAKIFIHFEKNRSPVNMNSLSIKAKKGIFSVSLNSRLAPYIRGTEIYAENVKIPSGRFRLYISIADKKGAKTDTFYNLEVK